MIWYITYIFDAVPPIKILQEESFIESFVFQKSNNKNLTDDIPGTVNNEARVVYFQNPDNVDITHLQPTITFNEKVVSYTPQGPRDFSYPLAYTLTLKNGKEIEYYILNENPPDSFNVNNNFWKRLIRGLKHF